MSHRRIRAAATGAAAASFALRCACGSDDASTTLGQRGYAIDAKGVCKAIGQGDVEALRLLDQAGAKATTLVIDGERFCLEAALAGKSPRVDLAALFAQVKAPRNEINRVYASATGMTARDVPQAEALARAEAVNISTSPLLEAHRLERTAIVRLLERAGAKASITSAKPNV